MNHCAGLATASLRTFSIGAVRICSSLCFGSSVCDLEVGALLLQLAVVHVNCVKLRTRHILATQQTRTKSHYYSPLKGDLSNQLK